MTDSDFHWGISEQDYSAIVVFNGLLGECRHRRSDFKELLKVHLLPLLHSFSCYYFLTEPDFSKIRIHDSVNIPEETLPFLPQFFSTDPLAGQIISRYRSVMAYDVDKDRKELDETRHRFFLANPQYESLRRLYIDSVSTAMAAVNLPVATVFLVFHRLTTEDRPYTLREVRILELLWPALLQTIQSIYFSEELHRYQSFADSLAAVATPIALINTDWQIVYCNASYKGIFSNQSYDRLPNHLIKSLRYEMNRYASEKFDAASIEIPFYRFERRTFWIKLAKIEVKINNEVLWLLRMERIVDVNCKMIRRLQEKGLTTREIEICLLLKEGMETRIIATRLCVSYNTTRNHLQSIFKKTCVTTQVQLSAYLNQYQE